MTKFIYEQYRNSWLCDSLVARVQEEQRVINIDYTAAYEDSFEWDLDKLIEKHGKV
jgi:hypothetical protein